MLDLTMLPARDGDSLLLSYGDEHIRRLLVDGGRSSTTDAIVAHLDGLGAARSKLEAAVVTHVDADHITGALGLISHPGRPPIGDVWFNAYHHLASEPSDYERFSAAQGERLSDAILADSLPWNRAFDGGAACVEAEGDVRTLLLGGGLRITLLSPDRNRLARLRPTWRAEVFKAGADRSQPPAPDRDAEGFEAFGGVPDIDALAGRADRPDRAVPNGTSIAFLAEWGGLRILFGADAHPDLLAAAIRPLADGGRLKVDLFKVAHHGSAANVTASLLELLDCERFAFSTDGTKHGHPDEEAVAKILRLCSPGQPKILYFNYRQPRTTVWADPTLMARHGYQCVFPDEDRQGTLRIQLA
jgi:beta-lactamase superfamily II metal-dependent hydrolase